jgi:hypothetical protein
MRTVQFGDVQVTRFIIGGNPFSGFSHQSRERDKEMVHYYTGGRIKETLRKAEAAGINTFFGRTDRHVKRMLLEYWDEGGQIQWFGQTASELGDQVRAIRDAAAAGAVGVYVHGGVVDHWYTQGQYDMLEAALGHMPEAHAWIRDNLEPDFQMCSYYNPSPRGDAPHHVAGTRERWDAADRAAMTSLIQTIPWPVVHYKIFGGGNLPIRAGFEFLAGQMRENDLTCVGHFLGDNPDMIAENVRTFEELVES